MSRRLVAAILAFCFLSLPTILAQSQAATVAAGPADADRLDTELIQAAAGGDTAAVEKLLQSGAHIDAADKWGYTALLQAVRFGKSDAAKLLLEKGANIEAANGDGTALILAAVEGNTEIARLLLERGANTGAADFAGDSALLMAVDRRDNGMLKLLLDNGADVQVKGRGDLTALPQAAGGGNVEAVKLLLQKGADIEARDANGETALHWAARNGRTEVVRLLLKKRANVEAKNRFGYTPLLVAAEEGKTDVVKLLLDRGAKPVGRKERGGSEAQSIEAKDDKGKTALHVAAHRGRTEEVKLLLDRGANIEARNNEGFTPLMCAAEAGGQISFTQKGVNIVKFPAVDVVNLLLDRGANIEAKSNWGQTALHRAAFRGRPDVVKTLLDRGANIQALDNHGDTALYLANASRRDWERTAPVDANNPNPGSRQVEAHTVLDKQEVVRVLEQALAQRPPHTFAEYVSDLQNHPLDRTRRDDVVKLAAALSTPPPIPEQAQKLYDRASALMAQGSEPQILDQPIKLMRWTLVIAPWWGDAYHSLSRALEITGQYDLAEKNLNYYLELNPPEAEARAARTHLAEIQTEKETGAGKK